MIQYPTPSEVHVHRIRWSQRPSGEAWLAPEERARARRFVRDSDRWHFIEAHAFMRQVLARYVGVAPREVRIAIEPGGRPILWHGDRLHFNLSHCASHAVVAIATSHVGVDIESHRALEDVHGLARRFFAPGEAARIEAHTGDAAIALFLRYWVCKEAFVKAIGAGLAHPLDSVVVELADGIARYASLPPDHGGSDEWTLLTCEFTGGQIACALRTREATLVDFADRCWRTA